MATKARRITIEVGGEDRGAGAALKDAGQDVDRLGKKLRSAGEDAEKGFRDVVTEADGLGGKLKTAGQDAGNKLTAGVKSGVSGIGSAVEGAGASASDAITSGFDPSSIADSLSGMLSSLGGKLGPVAAGAGMVIGGAMAVGVLNGLEEEASTDKLAARVGGGEWGEQAGEIAGDLYRDAFGESIADVGNTVNAVMTSNLVGLNANEDQIYKVAEAAATFSDVMEQDAEGSVRAVDRMIANKLVPNAEAGFDILTTGLQELGPAGDDLLDTFTEYSIQFAAIGLDGKAALGSINALMNAGVRNTDIAADALKEFGIRAIDPVDATIDAFTDLGFNADKMMRKIADGGPGAVKGLNQTLAALQDIEDPVERNRLGVELFGTQWEELKGTIATADLSAGAADLGQISGRTEGLGEAYENASTAITEFQREALHRLTLFVGEKVLPKLEALAGWAKENPTLFKTLAGVIGGVLVAALVAYTAASIAATAATLGWTWPFILAGLVIAALAGLVVVHFDTIKGAIMTAFNWVKDNWPLLLAILTGPIGIAVLLITKNWDTIKDAAMAAFNWVKENWPLILAIITGPIGLAVLAITKNWDKIKDGATAVKDWIVDRFNGLVGFVAGLPGRVGSVISGVSDAIKSPFTSAFDAVRSVWNSTVGGFGFEVPSWVPGVGGKSFSIPSMDVGGVVPGPLGAPQLIVAHGGETVVPTHDRQALARFTDDFETGPPPASDSGGGDTTVINIDQRGSTFGSGIDFERSVTRAINHARAKGVTLKGRRRTR